MRNVLVVDDDERLVGMYRRCFEPNWKVHAATTVDGAAQLAKRITMDAAILDLHLGRTSSIPLLRALRADNSKLRIVIVSAYLTTESTVIAVQAGADVVIDKPIHPREVLRKLQGSARDDIDVRVTPTLEEAIDAHIARVYNDCGGNVSETARRLGLYRSSLQRRLRKAGVKRP